MTRGDDDGDLELRDYLEVMKRRKWVIAVTTLLVAAGAVGASLLQTKVYQATAEVVLRAGTAERLFAVSGVRSSSGRQTEIQVMRSGLVKRAVTEELGSVPAVTISSRGDTDVVAISGTHQSPEEAARVVNTYAEVYVDTRRQTLINELLESSALVQERISDVDRRIAEIDEGSVTGAAEREALLGQRASYNLQVGELQLASNLIETGGAQIVSRADPPSSPIRPTPARNGVVALVVGLILGVGLAFLRDYLDDSLRTKEDLEKATGLTVLATIPSVPGWKRGAEPRVVTLSEPTSQPAEAYRSLRTSLQFLSLDRPLEVIQVTSATAGDGKTTTVANLAITLARAGQRVVVVDCDLRRPRIHQFFGVVNGVGLTSVLVGEASLNDAIQRVPGETRLALLASGPLPPNPSELLSSKRAANLFQSLRESADVVLLDSPPILPVTDGVVLASHVDATLVVGTASRATRRAVHRAVETLRLVGAPLVGGVLNGVSHADGYGYGYGYGYGSYKAEPEGRGRRHRAQAKRAERERAGASR